MINRQFKVFKDTSVIDDIISFTRNYIDNNSVFDFIMSLKNGDFDDEFFKSDNLISDPQNRVYPEFKIKSNMMKTRLDLGINIYENLLGISELDANNPRYWTYACLYVYRDFIFDDRKVDASISLDLLNRYYFFINPSATRNALNSISRLWWGIHQTVNYDLADRYQYSRILFENSETFQSITQRNDLFNNKKVLMATLDFIKNKNKTTKLVQLMAPYLRNHVKSFNINTYSKQEIQELLEDFLYNAKSRGLI
jgi:hypothetical protein